jgi:hypothetical protein
MLLQQHFGADSSPISLFLCRAIANLPHGARTLARVQPAVAVNLHYFGRTHASGDLIAAADNLRPHARARWDLGQNNYALTHLSIQRSFR